MLCDSGPEARPNQLYLYSETVDNTKDQESSQSPLYTLIGTTTPIPIRTEQHHRATPYTSDNSLEMLQSIRSPFDHLVNA